MLTNEPSKLLKTNNPAPRVSGGSKPGTRLIPAIDGDIVQAVTGIGGARMWGRLAACAGLAVPLLLAQTLPEGPGKQTFEDTCSLCHSPTTVIGMHKTKAEWKAKVTEMLQGQADVPESDRSAIIDYLARSFPATVSVNKASAMDLEVLFTPKDAAAIVQYRESKGAFKTIDDLKKVPGIDAARVDAGKEQLDFQ
jgi:competence protein ComEA